MSALEILLAGGAMAITSFALIRLGEQLANRRTVAPSGGQSSRPAPAYRDPEDTAYQDPTDTEDSFGADLAEYLEPLVGEGRFADAARSFLEEINPALAEAPDRAMRKLPSTSVSVLEEGGARTTALLYLPLVAFLHSKQLNVEAVMDNRWALVRMPAGDFQNARQLCFQLERAFQESPFTSDESLALVFAHVVQPCARQSAIHRFEQRIAGVLTE